LFAVGGSSLRSTPPYNGTHIVQHRQAIPARSAAIAALFFVTKLAVLLAQDPSPQVPPGYYPNGQYSAGQPANGNYPPGYGQGPRVPLQPTQPIATFGGPAAADAPAGIRIQEAKPVRPLYQPGQPASYVSSNRSARSMLQRPASDAAKLCELAQTLGRVGDDVVLTGDLFYSIDEMMARVKSRIPPEKFAEQRAALSKEVNDAIHEYATHVDAGDRDPAKGMSDSRRMLLYQMVRQQMDLKLIYQDFRKSKDIPKEGLQQIQESINRHFDDGQVKILMKREKVTSLADLENALRAKGTSLDRERRIFQEQVIAQQWAQQQIKPDGEEITHQNMIDWYQAHLKDFEQQPRVRWEELVVSFARHPKRDEAYATLAALGNRVLAGASLAEVAKANSEGPTARQGGKWDWTHHDSLDSKTINEALFSLPVGQLSPILEGTDGYHIVRVLDRHELTRTSFLDAQKEVKEKIQKERFEQKYQKFVEELRGKYPVWTVFDASMQPQQNPDDDDRYSAH
jgi:parvulin-like peptidyl-prolyl isomerase